MEYTLYTPQEAADLLRITRKTIYNWIHSGKITAFNLPGRGIRITREEIDRLTGKQPEPQKAG